MMVDEDTKRQAFEILYKKQMGKSLEDSDVDWGTLTWKSHMWTNNTRAYYEGSSGKKYWKWKG